MDLRLTHLDWNPEATLIHFQGQYLTICDLDYSILQGKIQNAPKTKSAVDIGEFCLVEDLNSARWYRGRVQNRTDDLFDVFLVDHGNVLSVDVTHISSCSDDLFILPPKIVCGFLANVLLLQACSHSVMDDYFSSLIGRNVTGYIQALLPHKVLLLEAPDINSDLVKHGFGRHVDTNTFLLLVEMLTEVPLKQNIEPVPDLLIEKPRGQEFSFKPSGLQGYEDILSFCGPRLSCGARVKVRVTAAVNPGLFYCQMTSSETDLWEMSKMLAAFCERRTKELSQKTETENLGLLCSVKSKDGRWYRGFVQYLPVNSQVRVLFIDYGYFESVKVENVHRLPPDCYSTPIMAFPCSLSALSGQDEAAKTRQLSFLKAGLLGGVLDVEINSSDEKQHLYFITVNTAEDKHVKQLEPIQEHPKTKVVSALEREESSPQGGYFYFETSMVEAFYKTLEAEEVQEDSVFVGYVEHVRNPNHFWIRTQKRNDEFEEMMTKLTEHFSQVKMDEEVLVNPELGTVCCAVYEKDMHFYRGVVTDTLDHGAEILFIDFGNFEKVPHMLIKKIPEAFASKSAFAFCCTLVNVYPMDEVWTSSVSDFFREAVSNKALLVRVVRKIKNKFVVDLYEMGKDNNQSITELLISAKQAEYWSDTVESAVKCNVDVSEQTRCLRYGVKSGINGSIGKEKDLCRNEIRKAQAASCFRRLNMKPGCEFTVHCSCIISPSDFWFQLLDKLPSLEQLMDKIQQHYSTHKVPLQSGDSCCVARSPVDGRWYRGYITETRGGYARVLLVDYGFIFQINQQNLQAIMPEHAALERQAFSCSLYTLIEPADPKNCGEWSPEACNSLKCFASESSGRLRCKILSQLNLRNKGLCNIVELYNSQTKQTVTDLLVEQGLAREVTDSTKQRSAVSPESFVYSSHDLRPGKEEQVYVTYICSQWEVYLHLERNSEIIEELDKKISEESQNMMQASTKAVVRNLCLAKYFDGKWYRGLALPVQSPLHLSVFFVDYGNTTISEKTHVMFIPKHSADLLYTPMQAVRCCLASVSREELYADVKEWLDGAILNKQLRVVIVGKNEDGSFEVELFDGDVNINEKLNEQILSHSPKPKTVVSYNPSRAKPKESSTSVKCRSQHKGGSSHSPTLNRHRGSAQLKKENATKTVYGKVRNKSCVSLKPQRNCQGKQYSECQVTKTRSEPPHQQLTKTTETPHLSCLPDNKVSPGCKAKCFVSHINSVNSFFLQLSEDEPAILKMGEELNSCVVRDQRRPCTSLSVDDLVLAEYEEDHALYRSVVKDCHESSCFVEFIDYGNTASVGKEKIYSIPTDSLFQPRFSIHCSLLDTSAYENDDSFTDALMEKALLVTFVHQHRTHWDVEVDILDGAVDLEATFESSQVSEKEEEPPACSAETEEKVRSCEQGVQREMFKNEEAKAENMTATVESKIMLKPAFRLSTQLRVKRRSRRRTRPRNKTNSKTSQSRTSEYFPKVTTDCTEAVIPLAILGKDTENGTVLSVQGNSEFYVRLDKTREMFRVLESCIADSLTKCETVAKKDIEQDLCCLAEVDSKWHRAVVQQVGKDRCQVLLVDHGKIEEISSDSLRKQCSMMKKFPNLAVLCKVNCPGLDEGEDAQKIWEETLKSVIGKEVKLVFVCFSVAENLWTVDIVMNEALLAHQIAASLQQNPEVVKSPAETPDEATGEPSMDTSPPQQLAFAPIDMDKSYSCFVAAVTTPFEFCVVLEHLLLVMHDVSIALDDLPGQMPPVPEAHLIPGTCCLLESDSRNKWCRAEIVNSDAALVLNLVDYGHCESMQYKDHPKLKRLPDELMKLPKVTYPCILRGVKPAAVGGQWTDEAAVFFQQCLYQKNLQIFFRECVSNTHWRVDVLADGVHVAKELVDAGHARYVDVMLELRYAHQISFHIDD